jgi:hemerythrin-like metal-binding protein
LKEAPVATTTSLLFPWIDTYSVKIGIIDMQHKNLVNIVNELHEAMRAGHAKEKLGQILSNLIKYTQIHFGTEEKFMVSRGYPEYVQHKAEHDRLTATVLDFQRKFQQNEVGLTVDVMEFLKDWLIKHILGCDKKYAPFLNERGVH